MRRGVAFKFRKLRLTEKEQDDVVMAVLANYLEHTDRKSPHYVPGLTRNHELAFALCYVATHFVLDLLSQEQAAAILEFCEERLERTPRRKSRK